MSGGQISESQCLVTPVTILELVNNFKYVLLSEPGGRRSSGLHANIPVAVLHVPAREEGRPGGLPKTLKEGRNGRIEEKAQEREIGLTSLPYVTKLSSLCKRLTSTKFGSTAAMC